MNYKLVLLLKSDLKKESREKLLENVKKWAGKVSSDKVTELGSKKLAYSIKGTRKGDYSVVEFTADRVSSDLEKRLLVQDEILRHLLVRVD